MKSRLVHATVIAVLGLSACTTDELPTATPSLKRAAGANALHIVTFATEGPVPASFGARVAELGGTLVSANDGGVAIVRGLSAQGVGGLRRDADITDVSPDAEVQLAPTERAFLGALSDAVIASPTNPATALAYNAGFQWSYRVIGMNQAWLGGGGNLGSNQVTVAILDTGIDSTHPDLAGRVDRATSISLVPSDDPLIAAHFPGAAPWTDLNGHGTHVGSTVASNAIVFSGMGTQTKLMAVKVLGHSGSGTFSGILQGIRHAVDNGADVINMSLGATFFKAGAGGLAGALDRTTKWAYKQGVTIVVAAGNDALNMEAVHNNVYFAPCEAKHVICVSGTGAATGNFFPQYSPALPLPATVGFDDFAVYSNSGESVDVAAPGGNFKVEIVEGEPEVVSGHFIVQVCSRTTLILTPSEEEGEPPTASKPCTNPGVLFGSAGTSQASPHVAGLAALLLAKNSAMSPDEIRAAIFSSADDRGAPGFDPRYGGGRINAARALGVIP